MHFSSLLFPLAYVNTQLLFNYRMAVWYFDIYFLPKNWGNNLGKEKEPHCPCTTTSNIFIYFLPAFCSVHNTFILPTCDHEILL